MTTNPTRDIREARVATLEGGVAAVRSTTEHCHLEAGFRAAEAAV